MSAVLAIALTVLAIAAALLVSLVALRHFLDFAARLHRYREHRRSYPSAPKGRVWRHVRHG